MKLKDVLSTCFFLFVFIPIKFVVLLFMILLHHHVFRIKVLQSQSMGERREKQKTKLLIDWQATWWCRRTGCAPVRPLAVVSWIIFTKYTPRSVEGSPHWAAFHWSEQTRPGFGFITSIGGIILYMYACVCVCVCLHVKYTRLMRTPTICMLVGCTLELVNITRFYYRY